MTALLPEKNQEQFPPTLFVTELATQRDVKLGEHYVMRCRLDVLSEKQVGEVLSCGSRCLGDKGAIKLRNIWECARGSLVMPCMEEERAGVELLVLPAVGSVCKLQTAAWTCVENESGIIQHWWWSWL